MTRSTIDGNEAAVSVAYRLNEVCCIYPITPASPMAELADEWASKGKANVWGTVPTVVEMQSEAGAAGALHGALQSGSLATTFTASQGLLLMIPNMYKIAGELTSCVMHVAARSLAAQGLSIFGDHQDVMAVRQTGWALLSAGSVQECHDLSLIAQAATLRTRVPFVHFFDGFRTSHELNTIELLSDDDLRAMVPEELVRAHRDRALSPERPFIRGTAQNPDIYFQARETVNPFYDRTPKVVQDLMDQLAERTGRPMGIVEYSGHPEAERVVVLMGSGSQTVQDTVTTLIDQGERVGVVQVRLYRPFPTQALLDALPPTATRIAVLDRTKEPGSIGEPLFLDVVAALNDAYADGTLAVMPRVSGARYGLSSKEFTPGMVAGVFAETRPRAPAQPVHRRHQRRRLRHQHQLRPDAGHRAGRQRAGGVLRPRVGRHRRRQQEHHQDPRRRGGPVRAGLFRLRLEEVRLADGVPPAFRAAADQGLLPGDQRELRRLPPVQPAGAGRRAGPGRARRHAAGELPASSRDAVGRAAPARAAADPGQEHQRVRGRRRAHRPRRRHGRPDQHRAADLLLRDLRSAATGPGHRQDQGGHRQELRQAGTRGRGEKPCRGGPLARGTGPDQDPRAGQRDPRVAAAGAGQRAGVRAVRSPPR